MELTGTATGGMIGIMGKLDTLPRITTRLRAGHRTRGLKGVRLGDTAVVFTLPGGGAVEVDLTATAVGGLVIRAHDADLRLDGDSGTVVVRPG